MSSLATFQEKFANALMSTDTVKLPGIPETEALMTEKFSIYRNNVWHSLSSALMGICPVSVRLVGEDFFRVMATQYAKSHLPASGLLIGYGDQLADFVRDFPAAATVPYLGDVIALEFARHRAYHAINQQPLALESLASIPPEAMGNLCFQLSQSATFCTSDYDVYGLWLAHQSDNIDQALSEVTIDQPSCFTVFRTGFEIHVLPLSAAQHALLHHMSLGKTLEDILMVIAAAFPEADAQLLLTQVLSTGCLVDASLSE